MWTDASTNQHNKQPSRAANPGGKENIMIDFIKTDIRNFNEAAQKIIAGSDNEALKDLFSGCETIEDVNAAADDLIDLIKED